MLAQEVYAPSAAFPTLLLDRPAGLHKATVLTIFGLFLVAWPVDAHLGPVLHAAFPGEAALPAVVLFATTPCVVLNTYFGAPLMFFFFQGWLLRPSRGLLAAGLPGRPRKAAALAAYFAVVLALGFFAPP